MPHEKTEILPMAPRVPSRYVHLANRKEVKEAIKDAVIDCLAEEYAKMLKEREHAD